MQLLQRDAKNNSDTLPAAQALMETLPKAMRMIRTDLRLLASSEMSVPQFRILAYLSRNAASSGELAELLGISPPNVTRLSLALTRKNYIECERDTSDRRRVVLTLTPKGRARFKELKGKAIERIETRLRKLSPEGRLALMIGMRALDALWADEREEKETGLA